MKKESEICSDCDGCGWNEGGEALQTTCKTCNGKGVIMKPIPKSKAPMPSEYQEQCQVVSWARLMVSTGQEPRLVLLHGDSSGVRLSIGAAVKMKKAGRIRGWPDIFLAVPMVEFVDDLIEYHGLFLEIKKRTGGVVSPDQRMIHKMLFEQGYQVEVCAGSDQAIRVIREYLGMEV